MIELPEALSLAKQLDAVSAKTVARIKAPTKPHKFCWFSSDPAEYEKSVAGGTVVGAKGFGIYVELEFDNGQRLCVNDGVNIRLTDKEPCDYQLCMAFEDGAMLVFTVAMYGGIILHGGSYDNEYYIKSRESVSPFCDGFEQLFYNTLAQTKPSLSAKAFLATQQRFPGIGNGVLQDILFDAAINPKRKLGSLEPRQIDRLFNSTRGVLSEMTRLGGRDTEKDIYGNPCGYKTKMSKNALSNGCPVCGGEIVKEAYMGGSVYYCPNCQPLN